MPTHTRPRALPTMAGILILALLVPTLALGQAPGRVNGRLSDATTGTAVEGAMVSLPGTPLGTIDESTTFDDSDFRHTPSEIRCGEPEGQSDLVEAVTGLADRKGVTQAQIALAWLLARKPWIVPIPGTTRLHRLEENLGAANVELTSAELAQIDAALDEVAVHGLRYAEGAQRMIDR